MIDKNKKTFEDLCDISYNLDNIDTGKNEYRIEKAINNLNSIFRSLKNYNKDDIEDVLSDIESEIDNFSYYFDDYKQDVKKISNCAHELKRFVVDLIDIEQVQEYLFDNNKIDEMVKLLDNMPLSIQAKNIRKNPMFVSKIINLHPEMKEKYNDLLTVININLI